MADLTRLEQALVNAHKAGDTEAAKQIAAEIRRQRAAAPEAAPEAMPEAPAAPAATASGEPQTYAEQMRQLRAEGSNEMPAWELDTSPGMFIDDLFRQTAKGSMFNWSDEAAAGLSTATGLGEQAGPGSTYEENLAAERARDAAFSEAYPKTALGANILGGGLSTALLARTGAPLMMARGWLPRILQGTVLGTTEGAIAGAGEGEEGSRTDTAVPGALLGAGLGALFPAVGTAINATPLKDLLREGASRVPLIGGLISAAPGLRKEAGQIAAEEVGMSQPTADAVRRAVAEDVASSGTGAIREGGAGAMLADVGPAARGQLDTVAQSPGGSAVAREAVEGRATRASGELDEALNEALGRPADYTPEAVAARGQRVYDPTLKEAYERAYSKAINYASERGQQLESIVQRRVPPEAIEAANKLMRVEGNRSRQILAEVGEDGVVTFRRMPDLRQLDYITRGLNQVAFGSEGKGALGGKSPLGSAYAKLAREMRNLMKEEIPEYGAATKMASQAISEKDAREVGEMLLTGRLSREDFVDALPDLGEAELKKVREGVRQYVDDTMARVKAAFSDPNTDAREAAKGLRELSSPESRDKLRLLMPDKADALFRRLDEATKAFELRAGVAPNSHTFGREATKESLAAARQGTVFDQIRELDVKGLGQKAVQSALGGAERSAEDRAAAQAADIARALTEARGGDAEALAMTLARQYGFLPQAEKALQRARAQQRGTLIGAGTVAGPDAAALMSLFGEEGPMP